MKKQPIAEVYQFCPRCAAPNPTPGAVPFRCEICSMSSFFGPVAAVGGLVASQDGELLLVERAREPGKGKLGLPGGFVDPGESIEQALARELQEEVGLDLQASRYLTSAPNSYDYHGVVAPVVDLFYVCRVDASQPITIEVDELAGFTWSEPTEAVLDQMAFPSNRRAVEYWLQAGRPQAS